MSLVTLEQAIDKRITTDQKVRIHVGSVFEKTKFNYKEHQYWGEFFRKYPENSVMSIKELLEFPYLNEPEWIVMYGLPKSLSFKEESGDKLILVGCSFGLMNIGTFENPDYIRPDYVYLEVI